MSLFGLRKGPKGSNKDTAMKEKPSKLKTIQVFPSTQIPRIKATEISFNVNGIAKDKENALPPLKTAKPMYTPSDITQPRSRLNTEETTVQPGSHDVIGNGNGSPTSQLRIPLRRRLCPDKECLIGTLVMLAFIFSVINLCLTLTVMSTRGQDKSCHCQENRHGSGKVLLWSFSQDLLGGGGAFSHPRILKIPKAVILRGYFT